MEISKNKKKLIDTKSELEIKISSKKDLHYILRQGCKQQFIIKLSQYYIPNMNQCPIVYLKDVLSGKKVNVANNIKNRCLNYKIKSILALQYDELTAGKMYSKVKGYIDNFIDYFSDNDESYISPRKYFWDIFSTLNQELAEKFIDHSIKERNKQKVSQDSKIEISEEKMNKINKNYFYFLLKERAFSMLVASRKIYKVNRKRKRGYTSYEVSKEEVKEYQKKRSEQMNIERSYDNDKK